MAKKKSQGAMAAPISPGNRGEVSSRVEAAENGFIVRLSRDNYGKEHKYESRTFVATSRPKAMRIAAHHLRGSEENGERTKAKRGKKERSSGR
jgi:hypothetical protein